MGGYGSGRSGWRPVVEYGLKLDSYRLQRQDILNIHRSGISFGSIQWTNTATGEYIASIGYEVNYYRKSMMLNYTRTLNNEKYPVEENIWLTTQKTNFGGSRFLFLCPKCNKRTAKLYLPNGALHFRCRRCYNLTYLSSNQSHQLDALFQKLSNDVGCSFKEVKNILKKK